jgi:5'-3' exoribonuclease 1
MLRPTVNKFFKNNFFLKGVLPPTSRQLLPNALQSLMIDSDSPLLHFYPENFELDQNEKKQDWEAIVLLPFIDEELLLNSITKFYNQLDSNEQIRNRHLPSLCFTTTNKLQPIGNSLEMNPYFPVLKETRAICKEFSIDYYQIDIHEIKYGRFDDKDMFIFPKFPVLNVLPYTYDYKNNAVNLFESHSKSTTLVLNLINQSNSDCIKYNNQWNPKDEKLSPPFQIDNIHLLIERYLGKCVFVNWPHFQYGIVCAISDYRHLYTWSNIPGGSYFYSEPINTENNQNFRNYIQTPVYVTYYPFEISTDNKKAMYNTYVFNEIETQIEYTKAININKNYENRQGVSIGPIPILLYVSPFIGYRTKCSSTSDKCRITMCFSNQALAYPLQTTLFKLPNYKSNLEQIPQTIHDFFKINDPIFALQSPYYSSLGYIEHINKDNHGKYSISCRMESSDIVNQPDIHHLVPKLKEHQLKYFTAQEIADQLKTIPCVISKITGKINVIIGGDKRRRRANPTNIGLSWKVNKPVKQVNN